MRLGTRKSELAWRQSGMVAAALGPDVELVGIVTEGDRIVDAPLRGPLAKGYFTEALEAALRAGTIDLAVHSLKDLPTAPSPGLAIGAVPLRERVADLLIVRPECWGEGSLPLVPGARVGATSTRRQALLRTLRSDCRPEMLRGNVPTRVSRLAEKKFDAIVLAEAGIRRLGLDLGKFRVARLSPRVWVPAPGQGALGVQCRADDAATRARVGRLHHAETGIAVSTERRWLATFGGGCSIPFGAWVDGDSWAMGLERDENFRVRTGKGDGDAALSRLMADDDGEPLDAAWEEIDVGT